MSYRHQAAHAHPAPQPPLQGWPPCLGPLASGAILSPGCVLGVQGERDHSFQGPAPVGGLGTAGSGRLCRVSYSFPDILCSKCSAAATKISAHSFVQH